MADPAQTYKNHARTYWLYHYVALPILLVNVLNSVRHLINYVHRSTIWEVVFSLGLFALAWSARVMALTVQDRVIRLEMQMRLARLLPPDQQTRIAQLRRGHFVALRFASDDELPELVREITEGRLSTPREIKMRVKNWQPDWLRA